MTRPPFFARLLLLLVVPERDRHLIADDLDEEFHAMLAEGYSRRLARGWYWGQTRASLWPSIKRPRHLDQALTKEGNTLTSLLHDIRFAIRNLRRSPAFVAIAVGTLAVGIGANSAVFSFVNVHLLRPLPIPEPTRAFDLFELTPSTRESAVAYDEFFDWRERVTSFDPLVAYRWGSANFASGQNGERIERGMVTRSFFTMLGATPVLGRVFVDEDHVENGPHVVVLSHRFWRSHFGEDSALVGQTIVLDDQPHEVIGIMGSELAEFAYEETAVWVPLEQHAWWRGRDTHWLRVMGRLDAGVTPEQASAELAGVARQLTEEFAHDHSIAMDPLRNRVAGNSGPLLWALLGAVVFVLLIATANIANLVLARATARAREFAVSAALGASRARLIRVALSEGLLLGGVAALGGLALSVLGTRVLMAIWFEGTPLGQAASLDWRVTLFTVLVSVVSITVIGLIPAITSVRAGVHSVLTQGQRSVTASRRGRHGRSVLAAVQFALSVVLLIGAGLMIKSLNGLLKVDPGFVAEGVLTLRTTLNETRYADMAQVVTTYDELHRRIAALPGIDAVATTAMLPVSDCCSTTSFNIEGRPPFPDDQPARAEVRWVSDDYFRVLRTQLLFGRFFSEQDHADAPLSIVINETMARQYWPGEDPAGRRITIGETPVTVVGVVEHVNIFGLDTEPTSELYLSSRQNPRRSMAIVMRGTGDADVLINAVRNEIATIDNTLPVHSIKTMEDIIWESVSDRRLGVQLLGGLGFIALVLAAIGIYSVLSYAVAQRAHEIGIRVALGAQRRGVIAMVLRQGMTFVIVGLLGGAIAAAWLTRLLESQLFGVTATDPTVFAIVEVGLSVVALAACYVPARRAAHADPVETMRTM